MPILGSVQGCNRGGGRVSDANSTEQERRSQPLQLATAQRRPAGRWGTGSSSISGARNHHRIRPNSDAVCYGIRSCGTTNRAMRVSGVQYVPKSVARPQSPALPSRHLEFQGAGPRRGDPRRARSRFGPGPVRRSEPGACSHFRARTRSDTSTTPSGAPRWPPRGHPEERDDRGGRERRPSGGARLRRRQCV